MTVSLFSCLIVGEWLKNTHYKSRFSMFSNKKIKEIWFEYYNHHKTLRETGEIMREQTLYNEIPMKTRDLLFQPRTLFYSSVEFEIEPFICPQLYFLYKKNGSHVSSNSYFSNSRTCSWRKAIMFMHFGAVWSPPIHLSSNIQQFN